MNLSQYIRKVIGYIGVDAGLIWIGDPCYIIHNDTLSSDLGRTWGEFCETIKDKDYHEFDEGVVVSTLCGDGTYPVIGLFEEGAKQPSAILIEL